ncbi:acyl-CoA dehydrogenase [Pseudoxanthomonas sp. JBR18]|uniref:acyl-CoA dehydrogenase n=1 Tax=Pseudoxanthomonas sp. JBR18 TaxID=2969308 RepID=UPI002304D521|nr:acyl-CoA dehydrogenase [Pseudoxanthomonas sp. JBR18]WCE03870.1 acyl-CoA dehydrogenase [Pseudoxanthomonas sp. JBR18]
MPPSQQYAASRSAGPQGVPVAASLTDKANAWLGRHPALPYPGRGQTLARWQVLAAIAADDLCVAKLLEAHYDAQAILHELHAPATQPGQLWAVWAAEPPGLALRFDPVTATLSGTKAWCSGARLVSHALITATHAQEDAQGLYAVALDSAGIEIDDSGWVGLGMQDIATGTLTLSTVPARQLADAGAYVERPGFWHGGAGIAACWYGAATAIAERLRRDARAMRDPHAAAHLGAIDVQLAGAGALLRQLASRIDAAPDDPHQRAVQQVRQLLDDVCRDIIDRVGRALGPGPLCGDRAHARRVADLEVFTRQSHAERELEGVGRHCAGLEGDAWTL